MLEFIILLAIEINFLYPESLSKFVSRKNNVLHCKCYYLDTVFYDGNSEGSIGNCLLHGYTMASVCVCKYLYSNFGKSFSKNH